MIIGLRIQACTFKGTVMVHKLFAEIKEISSFRFNQRWILTPKKTIDRQSNFISRMLFQNLRQKKTLMPKKERMRLIKNRIHILI